MYDEMTLKTFIKTLNQSSITWPLTQSEYCYSSLLWGTVKADIQLKKNENEWDGKRCGREQVDYFQTVMYLSKSSDNFHTISYLSKTKLIRALQYLSLVLC